MTKKVNSASSSRSISNRFDPGAPYETDSRRSRFRANAAAAYWRRSRRYAPNMNRISQLNRASASGNLNSELGTEGCKRTACSRARYFEGTLSVCPRDERSSSVCAFVAHTPSAVGKEIKTRFTRAVPRKIESLRKSISVNRDVSSTRNALVYGGWPEARIVR